MKTTSITNYVYLITIRLASLVCDCFCKDIRRTFLVVPYNIIIMASGSTSNINKMTINDFALACAIDQSPAYFTYDRETMLIIRSKESVKSNRQDFDYIEQFMEALISHESIHVVIKKMEGDDVSDSLDDIEIIVERNGIKFQVTLNNILFAKDISGIVLP